ncbi:hypothetical protein C8Q80DRAFT_1186021 [Daedaleopsis nitida]|nr:hypothetical protein C8Q80DRAFT_1186021 [Daedaleopsis nitida]
MLTYTGPPRYRRQRRCDPEYSTGDEPTKTQAGTKGGKHTLLEGHQRERLQAEFAKDRSLPPERRRKLAAELGLYEDKVMRWCVCVPCLPSLSWMLR